MGDARSNTGRSLLVMGAIMGSDVRICGPKDLWPPADVQAIAAERAEQTGARIALTDDRGEALPGADFVSTDVWVSMGEPKDTWGERVRLLAPYQVNRAAMDKTGNPHTKFMHCLPAFDDKHTKVGGEIMSETGMDNGLEVTDEVFESPSASSSTRPRTGCTPSRPCSLRRSGWPEQAAPPRAARTDAIAEAKVRPTQQAACDTSAADCASAFACDYSLYDRAVTDDSDLYHAHLRIDALQRRIEHLESHLRRLHEHVGLGRLPQHPAPLDHEVEAVKQLLAAGREEGAATAPRHHGPGAQGVA
jgi:hypothetical protein